MTASPILRRVAGLLCLPAALLFTLSISTLSIFTLSIGAQGTRLPQRMAPGNTPRRECSRERGQARVSGERAGQVATRDGLQLTLTADTGNVQVSSDAVGAVRYQVRIEADANDPAAQELCKEFVLTARGTPQGVTLVGQMPNSRDAERVWVTYEVHVPRRYSVEIATRAGDVTTQDIDRHGDALEWRRKYTGGAHRGCAGDEIGSDADIHRRRKARHVCRTPPNCWRAHFCLVMWAADCAPRRAAGTSTRETFMGTRCCKAAEEIFAPGTSPEQRA